ncbi:MAG: 3-phosphoshikimate 1-carboxyvinyltransferase [Bacteroidales bacterium]|jgi:3-phosphoshikimate 1-carboxyvinyltransferase|nr:3-phosphoshikimate 1-carboxyvinyltransferase [Bacteroidales bacterium]
MKSFTDYQKTYPEMEVIPLASSVSGTVNAPASKSAMQRAIACALLAEGRSEIHNPSLCDDAYAALKMSECLGAGTIKLDDRIIIDGGYKPRCSELFCGESGLGARLFTPLASLNEGWMEINGSGSLLKRPMNMLSETLSQMGVEVISNDGFLPLRVRGPMKGGLAFVDGSMSSQFLTGLLIALPVAKEDSKLIVHKLMSKPYIDLTIDILNHFGVEVVNENYSLFSIPGSQEYKPSSYTVEGDWSGAAFLLVLAALAGDITVRGISAGSTQSDRKVLDVLRDVGASVQVKDNEVRIIKDGLKAFSADLSDCPDLAPPLAVLASFCHGKSILSGTERLKVKESDRGSALMTEMSGLGVKIMNYDNRIEIEGPCMINPGRVDSHGDHRISMALTIMSVAGGGRITVRGAESVNKSYPSFYDDLRKLGVSIKISE